MRALIVMVLLGACAVDPAEDGIDAEWIDEETEALAPPPGSTKSGYGCRVTLAAGDVRKATAQVKVSFYSSPGCKGSYLGTDTLTFKSPSPAQVLATLAKAPKLAAKAAYRRVSGRVDPDVTFRRKCDVWVEGPGWVFDNYSGGHYECEYSETDPNSCVESGGRAPWCSGQPAGGGGVYGGGGRGDPCSTWDRLECVAATAAAALVPLPGFREFVTLLWSGQIEAAVTVLAIIGAQSAISELLSLPGFNGCACIASSIFSGSRCGLDGGQLGRYLAERLLGTSRDICDYGG